METLIEKIGVQILNPLARLLIAIAVVYFFWGVAKFIINSDNEQAREEGKKHMIWGIIGLFIMVGVWGIIEVVWFTLPVM